MSAKKLLATAILAIGIIAQTAYSERPAANITVAKGGGGMFASIQDAVNEAKEGYVIEITDTEVYEEQVTIDGAKRGITIRSRDPYSRESRIWS